MPIDPIIPEECRHSVKMLQKLKTLKHRKQFCDFVIYADGKQFDVHKNILVSASEYFEAMLTHDTMESREGMVRMKYVDSECVESCINFMYSGECHIPEGKYVQILHVASVMQLGGMKTAISDVFEAHLTPENFYAMTYIAWVYGVYKLSSRCENAYFENAFSCISDLPGFQFENLSVILSRLQSQNLNASEEQKLSAALRWFEKNQGGDSMFQLMKCINFDEVSLDFLSKLMEKHPVLRKDPRVCNTISERIPRFSHKGLGGKSIILFDSHGSCIRSYCPETDEVNKVHNENLNSLPECFTAVSLGCFVYVLGGDQSLHRLNVKNVDEKWKQMKDMIYDHGHLPPSAHLSGKIFVIGDCPNSSRVVEQYDPGNNDWIRLADNPHYFSTGVLVAANDCIYCIGGFDVSDTFSRDTLCRFKPHLSEWVELQPLKSGRQTSAATAIGQKIFVVVWHTDTEDDFELDGDIYSMECYDIHSNQWTSLSQTSSHSYYINLHHINGWLVWPGRKRDQFHKYCVRDGKWYKVKLKGVGFMYMKESVMLDFHN